MKLRHLFSTFGLAGLLVGVTAVPALAHAGIQPSSVAAGAEQTFTITAFPEGEVPTNVDIQVVVDEAFAVSGCTAPLTWTCEFDTTTHAPHTYIVYAPIADGTSDSTFLFTATAPADADGVYLVRVLQGETTGAFRPWVYEEDPWPAARLTVGDGTDVPNGDDDPDRPCFGPVTRPLGNPDDDLTTMQEPCPKVTTTQTPPETGTGGSTDGGTDSTDTGSTDSIDGAPAPAGSDLPNTGGGALLGAALLVAGAARLRAAVGA